jgi:hypothetical protein
VPEVTYSRSSLSAALLSAKRGARGH